MLLFFIFFEDYKIIIIIMINYKKKYENIKKDIGLFLLFFKLFLRIYFNITWEKLF